MKLLGVVIANGFSPEARVFASLLAERHGRYDPLVLHHDPSKPHEKDRGAPDDFARAASAPVHRFDAGWRRNDDDHRSGAAKIGSWAVLYAQLPRLVLVARGHRPDVVYSSQQRWDSFVAGAIARALGKPHVIHLHYTIGPWLGKRTMDALRTAAGIVCVSEFIRTEARAHGVASDRLWVVPNTLHAPLLPAADTRARVRSELGIGEGAPIYAFVARLAEGKGHADTLEAFARVTREAPDAVLVVVGDGPLRASLEAMASQLSIAPSVRFLGYRRDVPALLAASDAFVHPSRGEPFGLAILEAAALGLPTVAYREGGPAEIVLDGETGLLAPPGDIAALADRMIRLVREPAVRKTMGDRARADVAVRFDPKVQGARFADFLGKV